jgi:hypothetical protein
MPANTTAVANARIPIFIRHGTPDVDQCKAYNAGLGESPYA